VFTIVGPGATSESSGAKVTGGRLQVGDGSGFLTVDGTVSAREVPPANPWHYWTQGSFDPAPIFVPPDGVTKLAVTSLTIEVGGTATSANTSFELHRFTNANCTGPESGIDFRYTILPARTDQVTFPTPLVLDLTGAKTVCGVSMRGWLLTAVGYYF